MQLARVSTKATITAISPPYKMNVKKTTASEKLTYKRERGTLIVIRGAMNTENSSIEANPSPSESALIVKQAISRHASPAVMITALYVSDGDSLSILRRRTRSALWANMGGVAAGRKRPVEVYIYCLLKDRVFLDFVVPPI